MEKVLDSKNTEDHTKFLSDALALYYSDPIRVLPVYITLYIPAIVLNIYGFGIIAKGITLLILGHITYKSYIYFLYVKEFKKRWNKYARENKP